MIFLSCNKSDAAIRDKGKEIESDAASMEKRIFDFLLS